MQISVIVPIYNVEKYLPRCVDSLLAQTFSDFELILVDDGSPDNCAAICEEYARQDSRIRVIHRENGGLSAARNTGMDAAKGEYIAFIDSDDWVHPRFLEYLYSAIVNNSVPLSCCAFRRFRDNEEIECTTEEPEVLLMKPEEVYVNHKKSSVVVNVWRYLYHRDLLRDARFQVGKLYEDLFFTHKVIFNCSQVAYVDAELYFYYQRIGGIVRSAWNERHMDQLRGFRELIQHFDPLSYDTVFRYAVLGYLHVVAEQYVKLKNSDLPFGKKLKIAACFRESFYYISMRYGRRIKMSFGVFVGLLQFIDPPLYKFFDFFYGVHANIKDRIGNLSQK